MRTLVVADLVPCDMRFLWVLIIFERIFRLGGDLQWRTWVQLRISAGFYDDFTEVSLSSPVFLRSPFTADWQVWNECEQMKTKRTACHLLEWPLHAQWFAPFSILSNLFVRKKTKIDSLFHHECDANRGFFPFWNDWLHFLWFLSFLFSEVLLERSSQDAESLRVWDDFVSMATTGKTKNGVSQSLVMMHLFVEQDRNTSSALMFLGCLI